MESERKPPDPTSLHYLGDKGQDYLAWQNATGTVAGRINAKKFADIDFSNSTVVDFGAGAGNLLSAINARRKIAVEINPHAHQILTANSQEFVTSLQELPSGIADYVISNHALEHVPFPINSLQEINRILKPGGLLRMYLPIDDWRTQKHYNPDDINHHLSTWTPQLIGNCLQEAGFTFAARDLKVVTHAWPPGVTRIYRYPGFDFFCSVFAFVRRRRQLAVAARKP